MYSLNKSQQSWLIWVLKGLCLATFFALFARLFELQVIKGAYYKSLADENRIRRVVIQAPRGKILSSEGEVLADNKPVKKKIDFDPVGGYSKQEVYDETEEGELVTEYYRHYPLASAAAHILGYTGQISQDELGKVDENCNAKGEFVLEDITGRGGLEEYYDCELRGINGQELVEVNHMGQKVRSLGRRPAESGADLKTNINYKLQKSLEKTIAETELKELDTDVLRAAALVTDSSGKVKALYSYPSYDNNIFLQKTNSSKIKELMERKDLPLFNRVISGIFPPGSVYKPVISLAALEGGYIDPDFTFNDTGVITVKTAFGDFNYSNWYYTQYGGQEGEIDLRKALARSTDTFYYKVGEIMGVENIVKWSQTFGLNGKTNIDLPGEISGMIPTPEWKMRTKGERWFLGNTYHVSIGQGDMSLTPALVNKATIAVATGKLCDLKIVGDTECSTLDVSQEHLDYVQKAMVDACTAGGTGFTFFELNTQQDKYPKVGCKTGTAETGVNDKSHAWFVFFAPQENPEIVATVMVEEGGSGSGVAGVLAREIYNTYFNFKDDIKTEIVDTQIPEAAME